MARANVGPGFIQPLDPVRFHLLLLVELKIVGLQTELGEHFLYRNTLVALCKPVRRGDTAILA